MNDQAFFPGWVWGLGLFFPSSLGTHVDRQVECLMGAGKHEEAYAMSSALVRHSQNNPKLLIARARCLYLMGNLDSAVKHLQVNESAARLGVDLWHPCIGLHRVLYKVHTAWFLADGVFYIIMCC